MGYSPQGLKESEATEHTGSAYGADTVWLHTHDAPVSVRT